MLLQHPFHETVVMVVVLTWAMYCVPVLDGLEANHTRLFLFRVGKVHFVAVRFRVILIETVSGAVSSFLVSQFPKLGVTRSTVSETGPILETGNCFSIATCSTNKTSSEATKAVETTINWTNNCPCGLARRLAPPKSLVCGLRAMHAQSDG